MIFQDTRGKTGSGQDKAVRITGYIRDASSGESLIGAHVIDDRTGTGATTNVYGFFSLTVLGDTLSIGYVGYESVRIRLEPGQTDLVIELAEAEQLLEEVVVTDKLEIQDINQMSAISLTLTVSSQCRYSWANRMC